MLISSQLLIGICSSTYLIPNVITSVLDSSSLSRKIGIRLLDVNTSVLEDKIHTPYKVFLQYDCYQVCDSLSLWGRGGETKFQFLPTITNKP